jgi:hypothetical protein
VSSRPDEPKATGWNPVATVLFIAFLVIAHAGMGLYAARGIQPSPLFTVVYYLALAGLPAYWVHCDRLRTHATSSLDQGMYLYFTWPLALPIYLFRSRGFWRGLGALSLFILAFACAYGLSVAVWVLARARH